MFCVLLAFLIFSGLLAAQSTDLLIHFLAGAGTVVDGEIVASGGVLALMAKRTMERPLVDRKI